MASALEVEYWAVAVLSAWSYTIYSV
jgi:hypothetical protein